MKDWSGRLSAAGDAVANDERVRNDINQLRAASLLGRIQQSDARLPAFDFDRDELSRVAYLLRADQVRRTARERRAEPGRLRLSAEIFEDLARDEADGDRRLMLSAQAATMWSLAGYQANAAVATAPLRALQELDPGTLLAGTVAALVARDLRAAEGHAQRTREAFELFDARIASSLDAESEDGDVSFDETSAAGVEDALADAAQLAALGLLAQAAEAAVNFWRNGSPNAARAAVDDARKAARLALDAGIVDSWLLLDSVSHVLQDSFAVSLWRRLPGHVPMWNRLWEMHVRLLASDDPAVVELWPSQLHALEAGLLDPERPSLTLRMPTSAGKTRLADFALLAALGDRKDDRLAALIVPTRALAAEVEGRLARQFNRLGVRVSALFGGFDHTDYEAALLENTDILVATAEKLDLLLRQDEGVAARISLVLVDEAQIVGTPQRGMGVELLLSRIRRGVPRARILAMSAVLPNTEDLSDWLATAGQGRNAVESSWTPSRVHRGVFSWRGRSVTIGQIGTVEYEGEDFYLARILSREPNSTRSNARPYPRAKKETAAELTLHFARLGPVLVGCATKPQTDWVASGIRVALDKRGATGVPTHHSEKVSNARQSLATRLERWLPRDHPQLDHVRRGFALHRADQPDAVLREIEHAYRAGVLHVLVATSTLSEGVNLPTQTVLVPYTRRSANESLTVAEFKNLAGRAGRAFTETEGHVILMANDEREASGLRNGYLGNDSEDVVSTLIRLYIALIRLRIPRLREAAEVTDGLELEDPDPGDESFPHELLEQLDMQLLSLAAEEVVDTPDEEVVREYLSDTLWSVQAASLQLAQAPFVRFTARRWARLKEAVPDASRRSRFFRTGLRVPTCQELDEALEAVLARSPELLDEDHHHEFVSALITVVCSTEEIARSCRRAGINSDAIPRLAAGWLDGVSISGLFEEVGRAAGVRDVVQMATAVESVIARDLPWVVSASIELLRGQLDPLWVPDRRLSALPGMLKFGVSSVGASYAASVGIRDRSEANSIGAAFEATGGTSLYDFVRWLAGLSVEELSVLVSEEDAGDVLSKVAVLATSREARTLAATGHGTMNATLRGLGYESRASRVEALALPVRVVLWREGENVFDPNAISVRSQTGEDLGYVAREAAAALAPLLDEGAEMEALLIDYTPGSQEASLRITVQG